MDDSGLVTAVAAGLGNADAAATALAVAARTTVGLLLVRDGVAVWFNHAARELVGPRGGSWDDPDTADGPLDVLGTVPPGSLRQIVTWTPPTGDARWWQVTCTAMAGPAGGLLYEVVDHTSADSADRSAGTVTPHWRLDRLEALAHMGSWVWDIASNTLEWSGALLTLYGLPDGEPLEFERFRELVHPDDRAMVEEAWTEGMATGKPFSYVQRSITPDGVVRVFDCHAEVITDPAGTPVRVLGTARDITEEHRNRTELAYLAEHDPLTGIANRRRITARLAECAADPAGATLILIDIDHFKDINDLRGHGVGDKVIRDIATTASAQLPPGALLGRLGGDEFAAVLPRDDDAAGLGTGERICDAVGGRTILDDGSTLRVTVSVGVAGVPHGQEVETALARADLALYEAKNAGRGRARLFAPDQYRQAVARVGIAHRIATALDEGGMALDAQPIVDLATGRADRCELLVRLRDGREPELTPAQFLPAAERSDLVLRLDRWVLERAVEALADPRALAADLRLEVNISARSLEDADLGGWVLHLLAAHDVRPARLGLEMTETMAITNVPAARRLVRQLTEAGCGFSLDDFGAGFGSFSHLKHLPFTAVKIDGEFVRRLDADPVDRALVAAVVGVAGQLGMRTVAEQVERAELVAPLRELGVHDGQGYHLGVPRPLTELLGVARG
jgi:diguanylate cyclase (GGDEF)-like protein/PAS domain S-box-containing protein